jgi:coenzyme F420 hydrogenase subunit beta
MAGEAEVGTGPQRIERRPYVRLPTFLEHGFDDLHDAVTAKRICCLCGTCAAFCDKIAIRDVDAESGKKEPAFMEAYDTVCGLCYAFCPRTFLPQAELERRIFGEDRKRAAGDLLGLYRSGYAVRSKRAEILGEGQDGGAVTSLLAYALAEKIIDCSVITSADDQWQPITKIARTYEELIEAAGTKYTLHPSVIGVRAAIAEGCEQIGFVGLPCQIQGLRKVQTAEQPYDVGIGKVKLLIGLFCMENFTDDLLHFVGQRCFSGSLADVRKFEIRGKELLVTEKETETHRIPLDELKSFIGEGCLVCMDYTAELADIAVGSVGSEEGWSTVFARTELGEQVLKGAIEAGYLEVRNLERNGLESIKRLAKRKKESGMRRKPPTTRFGVRWYH